MLLFLAIISVIALFAPGRRGDRAALARRALDLAGLGDRLRRAAAGRLRIDAVDEDDARRTVDGRHRRRRLRARPARDVPPRRRTGPDAVEAGEGGGLIGVGVSGLLTGALGAAGAWVVLVLLAVVGLLLYFNMTVGDLVAAYLAGRDSRRRGRGRGRRRAAVAGRRLRTADGTELAVPAAARAGLLDRVRDRLSTQPEVDDEPPVIVRRERPGARRERTAASHADPGRRRRATEPTATPPRRRAGADRGGRISPRWGSRRRPTPRSSRSSASGSCPTLDLLADAPESSAAQMDLTAKGQRIRETLAHFGIGVKVARIQEGPVVTQYALDVEPGHQAEPDRGSVRQPGARAGGAEHPDRGADPRRAVRRRRDPELAPSTSSP